MTDGAICGMVLMGFIMLIGVVSLVMAWGEIHYLKLKAERHDEVMSHNLDLIEAQERALKFAERRSKDDYRRMLDDQFNMVKIMNCVTDDVASLEAMMAAYLIHVGLEPDIALEHITFNSIDTK